MLSFWCAFQVPGFDPVDLSAKMAHMTPGQREAAQAAFAVQLKQNPKSGEAAAVPSFDDAAKLMQSLPHDPVACAACAIAASYLGGALEQLGEDALQRGRQQPELLLRALDLRRQGPQRCGTPPTEATCRW